MTGDFETVVANEASHCNGVQGTLRQEVQHLALRFCGEPLAPGINHLRSFREARLRWHLLWEFVDTRRYPLLIS